MHVHVLCQEAGHHHSHILLHPASLPQLPHACTVSWIILKADIRLGSLTWHDAQLQPRYMASSSTPLCTACWSLAVCCSCLHNPGDVVGALGHASLSSRHTMQRRLTCIHKWKARLPNLPGLQCLGVIPPLLQAPQASPHLWSHKDVHTSSVGWVDSTGTEQQGPAQPSCRLDLLSWQARPCTLLAPHTAAM